MTPHSSRENAYSLEEEAYDRAIGVIPKKMTNPEPTDYAALIRAVAQGSERKHPEWLDPGQQLYSPKYGQGEVISVLGNTLIAKFPGYSIPVQYKNWQQAVEADEIAPAGAPATPSSPSASKESAAGEVGRATSNPVGETEINAIPQPKFRAIAFELAANLTALRCLPPTPGSLYAIPKDLPAALQNALLKLGINELYSHQIEALTYLRKGCDLSIVTPTASGKTLCYNLAILEDCLNDPQTTALYIFPLKALAFDQFGKLQRIVGTFPREQPVKVAQMTGDTPHTERLQLFVPHPPNILAVSPDLLHYQLEKTRRAEWEPWREFLRRLRWVVVDESHTYTGAFGAHFANLMRRLRRAVDSVGGNSSRLQFICSSATIGNPREMAMRFSGRTSQPDRLHLIEGSGAGSAGKTVLCLAPSDTANSDACKIVLAWLQQDSSGIVFCNSRGAVKKLVDLIQKESTRQGNSYLAQKVTAFYGSLKSDRRRDIISQLERGKLKVIISTSALEAGLDLPQLDCCLVKGYPGSIMSFRQRLGRAGRVNPGLVIFLPLGQNSLDYYYGKHPEQLLSGEAESAAFNPNYPTIASKHLECCCVESGLPAVEVESRFDAVGAAVAGELLEQEKLWLSRHSTLRGIGYPHRGINLRGSAIDTVELIDSDTGESFEEMPRDTAYREVFPGAIYTAFDGENHLITYRCESLNVEQNRAILQPFEDSSLFTESDSRLQVKLLENLESPRVLPTAVSEGRLRLTLGWGSITSQVTGYKLGKREYRQTCTNVRCRCHRQPLEGKVCPSCSRTLKLSETNKLIQIQGFDPPYQIQYQAPVVKVEVNPGIVAAITDEVNRHKASAISQYGNDLPQELKALFESDPVTVALHSTAHQIQLAVPLVVLSSTRDVNCVVERDDSGAVVAYFFDTTDGGNGASEEIGKHLPLFAEAAKSLALTCECSDGCPKCLFQIGCPQQNEALHKKVGLFLLEAIVANSARIDCPVPIPQQEL